jgi:hypothetical protein
MALVSAFRTALLSRSSVLTIYAQSNTPRQLTFHPISTSSPRLWHLTLLVSAPTSFPLMGVSFVYRVIVPRLILYSAHPVGVIQTAETGFDYNGESNLDLQYGMALVTAAQNVTLYQVGDTVEGYLCFCFYEI